MATKQSGTHGDFYGSLYSESEPLTLDEMTVNAKYIHSFLTANGWTSNAISAMLGNMQAESTINPGRWQSDEVGNTGLGYGLVQWTPATKYLDWCSERGLTPNHLDSNLERILYELENNIQWIATNSYDMSFKEFSRSERSVDDLAKAFLLCYERPADQSESVQNHRASLSVEWFKVIHGGSGGGGGSDIPSETTKKKKRYNFILFNRRRTTQWIK